VFEILALAGDDDAPAARMLARASAAALDCYLARDFVGGSAACDEALARCPDDAMLLRLRERCRTFVASPPSGDWSGVFHATDK
jgi:hypothetical protein